MPITLINESGDNTPALKLVDGNGKLTVEAVTIATFLAHMAFAPVLEHEAVAPHLVDVTEGEGDDAVTYKTIDGAIIAKAIDESDMLASLCHYLDTLPTKTLSEKATIAVWQAAFGLEEGAEGGFAKLVEADSKEAKAVIGTIVSVLERGAVKVGAEQDIAECIKANAESLGEGKAVFGLAVAHEGAQYTAAAKKDVKIDPPAKGDDDAQGEAGNTDESADDKPDLARKGLLEGAGMAGAVLGNMRPISD